MIGGMGEKILLKMVAQHADYCNFFLRENLQRSLDILKAHCKIVGRDYNDIGKSLFAVVKAHCKIVGRDYNDIGKSLFAVDSAIFISESEEEVEAYLKDAAKRYDRPIKDLKERLSQHAPGSWVGHPDDLIERFKYLNEMGFDYFQVMFPGHDESIVEASKVFAEKVMKKI